MQFKAGYVCDAVAGQITDFRKRRDIQNPEERAELDKLSGLLRHLSCFDVEFPYEYQINVNNLNPVLAIINNIVTRGLPTLAPVILEEALVKAGVCEVAEKFGEVRFKEKAALDFNTIFELLHLIEPGLEINRANYGGNPGSNLEWSFIGNHPFLAQILESQRDFSTINNQLAGGRSVDFSFTSPYLTYDVQSGELVTHSRIFEIDGHQDHFSTVGKYYDAHRDALALENNFNTLRFTAEELRSDQIDFEVLVGRNMYQVYRKNFERNVVEYVKEYTLIFMPLAVARIIKTLIELFISKPDLSEKDVLKIGIIERDLPCAGIALEHLQEMVYHINSLVHNDERFKLPKIDLTIFPSQYWQINPLLHLGHRLGDEHYFANNEFDLIIDNSILRRSNILNEKNYQQHQNITVKVRSAHYYDTSFGKGRRVYCAELLRYKKLVEVENDGTYKAIEATVDSINFFIQNVFRKKSFREGQLPIISRALQNKPVIGLLPTGGGKSLAYQLPALLQPGLCLIVDPIKSLMEDQVRVLRNLWIDNCNYINSNLKRNVKNKNLVDFRYGETQFFFISPERLVIKEFRRLLKSIHNHFGLAFSFCVIDEVHCVSEWGHDFRTSYLMLGKNAQENCSTRNAKPVNLIGLTATASFDVLSDIERELKIKSNDSKDATISIDNTIRPELYFNIIEQTERPKDFPIREQNLKNFVGHRKQVLINQFYNSIIVELNSIDENAIYLGLEQHLEEFELMLSEDEKKNRKEFLSFLISQYFEYKRKEEIVTIIFCPHITGSLGVTVEVNPFPNNMEVFENLELPIEDKGFFMGGDDRVPDGVKSKVLNYFIKFLEGKISTIVCTKAFGMGIDKDNIRVVTHINYSSSPESYIQEAGRAGRDKAKSICNIVYDGNAYYSLQNDFFLKFKEFKTLDQRRQVRGFVEEYVDFQSRIHKLLYKDKKSLLDKLNSLKLDVDFRPYLVKYNLDRQTHQFFHENNFKGIETEIYQLARIFDFKESIFVSNLTICENKLLFELDEKIRFNLTRDGRYIGNMLINNSQNIVIGKIFTNNPTPSFTINGLPAGAVPDEFLSKKILDFLVDEWRRDGTRGTLFEYLVLQNEIQFNDGYSLNELFDKTEEKKFIFQVPGVFKNGNLPEILNAELSLQMNLTISEVNLNESFDFNDYILRIEENCNNNFSNSQVFIHRKAHYRKLYYSDIAKIDLLRIIYRLNSIGFIDNYSMDYNRDIIEISVIKEKKEYYIKQTEKHLLNYLSKQNTEKKIDEIRKQTEGENVFFTIKKCVRSILEFTYDDIVRKRKVAVDDLEAFIKAGIESKKNNPSKTSHPSLNYNLKLKEEFYYYFNAKYARSGFKINGEDYSLTDDTDKGRVSDWNIFKKYADILNQQNAFINECKMMRGSCRRIWRSLAKSDYESEFIIKILHSYATFGLNNSLYFEEAQRYFTEGFMNYYDKVKNYQKLQNAMSDFESKLFNVVHLNHYKDRFIVMKHSIMQTAFVKYINQLNNEFVNI